MRQGLKKATGVFIFPMLVTIMGFAMAHAAPNDPVGKVVALRGSAVALGSGEKTARPLSIHAPVFVGDTIQTIQGRLQIMFMDNTLITLGRNTQMVLEEYLWKARDPKSTMHTRVKAGSFRVMGGAITRDAPDNFKTDAPSATIGIRGSMYAGIVKGEKLSVVYQGGRGIFVENAAGRVEIDRPGFGTHVTGEGVAPSKPEKFDAESLTEIEGGMAASDSETQTNRDTAPKTTEPQKTQKAGRSQLRGPASPTGPRQPLERPGPTDLIRDELFPERIPDTGIWTYKGTLTDTDGDQTPEDMVVYTNWDNRRFIAFEQEDESSDSSPLGFVFGRMTETGEIVDVRVLGSDDYGPLNQVTALTGSEMSGFIYGQGFESIRMVLEGMDVLIQDQTQTWDWTDQVNVFLEEKATNTNDGSKDWEGFFIGVGEDMANPNTNRVSFINADSGDFTLAIKDSAGTLEGSLSATDFLGSSTQLNQLTIGGNAQDSAYISDSFLGAVLTGNTHVLFNGSGHTDLKPHGNFLVSSLEGQLSDETYWGYWEIAYKEPGTAKDFHVHVPGALWIAGEKTPASVVQARIDKGPAADVATFTGGAVGVTYSASSPMTALTNGQTNLTVDFGSNTVPVSGTISFSEITLNVTSGSSDLTASGFNASVSSATASEVNGAFFGSGAKDLGGNFSADFSGTVYQGIFAGKQP